jgi:type IV secretory pathway TrbD component
MEATRLILGAHLLVGAIMIGIGLLAAVQGQFVQLVLFVGIGVMIALLGRSASRLAARR